LKNLPLQKKIENYRRNRYSNILPNENSRFVLSGSQNYINANWVNGIGSEEHCYIATQGPLENTVQDFWQMVWESKSIVIVMLTKLEENGRSKCYKYWPEENEPLSYFSGLTVQFVKSELKTPEIESVTFELEMYKENKKEEKRIVTQLKYLNWPDHGVPETVEPFLDLIKFYDEIQKPVSSTPGKRSVEIPGVIHCSAGIGRTGTFLLVHTLSARFNKEVARKNKNKFQGNLFVTLLDQRINGRFGLVQTDEQYIFAAKTLKSIIQHTKIPKIEVPFDKLHSLQITHSMSLPDTKNDLNDDEK